MTIKTTGMNGFSEEGSPDNWDFGVGEVYGYRVWKLDIPPEVAGFDHQGGYYASYIRRCSLLSSYALRGANNHLWRSGKIEAACAPMWPAWTGGQSYIWGGGSAPLLHEPPEYREPCGCGFWAYFDPDIHISTIIGGVSGGLPRLIGGSVSIPVIGVIRGTGRVIIGEKGFRSQYAEIVGLSLPPWAVKNLSYDMSHCPEGMEGFDYSEFNQRVTKLSPPPRVSAETRLLRISGVEALLSATYPNAKIMCDQQALVAYFPPDKNYGEGSAFQRGIKSWPVD